MLMLNSLTLQSKFWRLEVVLRLGTGPWYWGPILETADYRLLAWPGGPREQPALLPDDFVHAPAANEPSREVAFQDERSND